MSPEKFKVKLDLRTKMNMVESQAITLKITRLNRLMDKSTDQLGYKQKAKFTSTRKVRVQGARVYHRVLDPGEIQGVCLSKQDWIFII